MHKYFFAPYIILGDILRLFIVYMPGRLGFRLRHLYYKSRFKKIGSNSRIDIGVHIEGAELISLGDNVYIDKYCIISTGEKVSGSIRYRKNNNFRDPIGEIYIGNDVHIGQFCIIAGFGVVRINDKCGLSSGVKVYSLTNTPCLASDRSKVISIMPLGSPEAPYLSSPVVLEQNVWLGINVIVMPSVTVGKNSFCASNSVLIKSFPANSYLDGQPAVLLRNRFQVN